MEWKILLKISSSIGSMAVARFINRSVSDGILLACLLAELSYASKFREIFIDIYGNDPQYLGSVVILTQVIRVAGTSGLKSQTFNFKGEGLKKEATSCQ
jgi:hypothetical protein